MNDPSITIGGEEGHTSLQIDCQYVRDEVSGLEIANFALTPVKGAWLDEKFRHRRLP